MSDPALGCYTGLILRALNDAARFHDGMTRKGSGEAYIMHPIRVATILKRGLPEEVYAAAFLHDVLEDVTDADLSTYPSRVQELVSKLTATGGKIHAIKQLQHDCDALRIKMADRLDNLTDGEEGIRYGQRDGVIASTSLLLASASDSGLGESRLWRKLNAAQGGRKSDTAIGTEKVTVTINLRRREGERREAMNLCPMCLQRHRQGNVDECRATVAKQRDMARHELVEAKQKIVWPLAALAKLAEWLERAAKRAKIQAQVGERFPSYSGACKLDAESYAIMAADARAAIARATGKE